MKFVFIIAVAVTFIARGEALECISCVEGKPKLTSEFPLSNCNEPFALKSSVCMDASLCVKLVAEYEGEIAIVRHCMSSSAFTGTLGINEELLEMTNTVKVSVYGIETEVHFCGSNFCNRSSALFMTTTLFILSMVTLMVL